MKKYLVMAIDTLLDSYKEIQKRYNKIGIILITKQKYPQPFFILLKLDFLDVEKGQKGFIQKRHINMLKTALPRIKECETIIVCCDAGISRSPAVAGALAKYFGDWTDWNTIMLKYSCLNKDVYDFVFEELRKEDDNKN
jgi:hypothetical protein